MVGAHFISPHVFANDDLDQVLHAPACESTFTKTKVCITMGPAINNLDTLCSLLEAGAVCARIDLTWTMLDHHRRSLKLLQDAMRRTRRLCAVMLDCLGRDVLVRREFTLGESGWPTNPNNICVAEGDRVILTTDPKAECGQGVFPVTYSKLPSMVRPGDSITLGQHLATGADKSSVVLEVLEVRIEEGNVMCQAQNSGELEGLITVFHQERAEEGVSNLQNSMPVLDEWDKEAITALTKEFEIDFVTLSYCRSREDVEEARNFLHSIGKDGIKIVAKCETRQSLVNFKSIANEADAVMIARGNLGLDVAPEKMAMVQKAMISACSRLGKPSIVARVVDTMAATPRPTRAEATDVANAVLDGADGIMLGAETYRGMYPLETVKTVAAICREAERVFDHHNHFEHLIMDDVDADTRRLREIVSEDEEDHDPELPRSRLRRTTSSSGELSSPVYPESSNGTNGLSNGNGRPSLSKTFKLESIATGAVKAADKVGASLIVCITHTGRTASVLAKYRPPMPIMTLVVPYLKSEGLKWILEGRSVARQALLTSGLLPVLAAPTPSVGEGLLEEAVAMAASQGLVKPSDHIVAVSYTASREPTVKVLTVNESGNGIKRQRPTGLLDMLRAAAAAAAGPAPAPTGVLDRRPAAKGGAAGGPPRLGRLSVVIGSREDPLVDTGYDADEVQGQGESFTMPNGVNH